MTITKIELKHGVLACGIAFLTIGIMSGEHRIVLGKAIKICLECIGIG